MENEDQSVHFVLLTGKTFEFSVDEFLELMKEPLLYILMAFTILLDYVILSYALNESNITFFSGVLWAVSIAVTMFCHIGGLLFLCTTKFGTSENPIFEPIVALFAATVSSVFAGPFFLQTNLIPSLMFAGTVEALLSAFVSIEVGVLGYSYFIRPHIIARLEQKGRKQDPVQQAQIQIGTQSFSPARMRYVKSENQYVRIFTDFGDTLLLGAIKDVAEQLDNDLGMVVHRSYFVMRRDAFRIEKDGGNKILVLTDNTRIPMARRRAAKVEAWLKTGNDTG